MFRSCCGLLVIAVAGCASTAPPSGGAPGAGTARLSTPRTTPADAGVVPASHSNAVSNLPFRELLPLLQNEQPEMRGSSLPDSTYGTWLAEKGRSRTWMVIENPSIRFTTIDKETGTGWVMEGQYGLTPAGSFYGVMTSLTAARACRQTDDSERLIPVVSDGRGEKIMMPFSFELGRAGTELTLSNFRGTRFESQRQRLFHGSYQQVSRMATRSFPQPVPLGTWIRESSTDAMRLILVLQPGRFEMRLFDHSSGERIHVKGKCDAAVGGVLVGVITQMEYGEVGQPLTAGGVPAQVFCWRYASESGVLDIQEVRSLDLLPATEKGLLGQFRTPPPEKTKQNPQRPTRSSLRPSLKW